MSVDKETVRKIARLARIAEPEERLDGLVSELNTILTWVEQLNEVDVGDAMPMSSAVEVSLPMREDKITDGGYAEKIVQNAPEPQGRYFSVPKVVE